MDPRRKMDETIRLLKKHYWGNILILLLFFLPVTLGLLPVFDGSKKVNLTVEMYDIVITIIAIPLSLKFFANKVKKAARPIEVESAIRLYNKASFWRLYTLSAITLGQILLYGLSGNKNFFWLTVVLLTVFLFCKPSYVELTAMTERVEKEETNPETMNQTDKQTDKELEKEEDSEEGKGEN